MKDERKHTNALAKKEDLLVPPANKDKAEMIRNLDRYREKIRMLQYARVYEKLKKDLTTKYKERLVSLLSWFRE